MLGQNLTDLLTNSSAIAKEHWRIVIYGPPGHGKTVLSASFSEKFPSSEEFKSRLTAEKREVIKLTDMLWMGFDNGACNSLASLGLEVDVLDYVSLRNKFPNHSALDVCNMMVNAAASAKDKTTIVVDTLSKQVDEYEEFCKASCEALVQDSSLEVFEKNSIRMYRQLASLNRKFKADMFSLKKHIIMCCHSHMPTIMDKPDADKEELKAFLTLPGGAKVEPQLTGQAKKIYLNDPSMQLFLVAQKSMRQAGKLIRKLYSSPNQKAQCKNRFAGLMPEVIEEPHLREIYNMVVAKLPN